MAITLLDVSPAPLFNMFMFNQVEPFEFFKITQVEGYFKDNHMLDCVPV